MPSWKKVIVSGSDAVLNSLKVATNVTASSFTGSFTGSLFGTASYATQALTSSYALTASYASNIKISGSINDVDYIDFQTGSDQPIIEGRLGWDDGNGTLALGLKGGNVTLQVGQEQVARVFNADSVTLTDGMVVYISGSQGNRIAVKRAVATAEMGSANTLGMVTEPITAGSEGFITTFGVVNGLNTIGLTPGVPLWLSTASGEFTQTKPNAPYHNVMVGYVQRVHATVGSIFVKIDNGYELDELHNVVDSTISTSFGDLLVRSGSVWTNSRQLTGSYGLTGSLQATSFTGSLFGTASYAAFANTSSYAQTASFANNFTVAGTLTAQTIVVQTITSSVAEITGSTQFGSTTANTHEFTGSVAVSGSLVVNGSSVIRSNQTSSMSVATASYVLQAVSASFATLAQTANTASYVLTAQTASYVLNAVSASRAVTASYANNADLLDGLHASVFATTGSNSFNGNQVITGSLAVGSIFPSSASTENTLTIGLPPAGGTGEGGQILFQASGGLYTSASMLDN